MTKPLLVFFLVLSSFARVCTAQAEIVHMGLSGVGLYELPSEIAKRKGFYDQEKLEVRKVTVGVGIQVAALLAGELDYSTVASTTAIASVQGLPVKTVMGWFDRPLHMLVARPQIKTIAELKGKRVAVSAIGSPPHILVREAFRKTGLNPDKDATFLAVGGSSDRLAALMGGTVDATPLDVAYIVKTEQLGLSSVVYLGDVVDLRLGGLAVATEKIDKNPDQIRRVVRATWRGITFLKANKVETLAIMQDYLRLSPPHVERVYQYAVKSLTVDGGVAKASLENELKLLKERLKLKEDIPMDKVADWRFVKELSSLR
jgi:ABC-type nitrate/sulfonate/bicarbonate transport system substrate-binding protein